MGVTETQRHMNGLISINDKEFKLISDLVYKKFGINLTDKKRTLVRGRLNTLLREMGFTSFEQYYTAVVKDTTGKRLVELVDRISTNHTFFFRESDHFDFLREKVLPGLADKLKRNNSRDVRIWCAGCASGEEAYTLAIVLSSFFGNDFFIEGPPILATDISSRALEFALQGIYPQERLREISPELLKRYFTVVDTRFESRQYQVKDNLKKLILFKRLNFQQETFPFKGIFNVIFCRNVMIYFDKPTKEVLVKKFHRHLEEGSYFFIGHSETLGREDRLFTYVQPAVYKRIP